MTQPTFADVYDDVYASKDYASEAATILQNYTTATGSNARPHILDIGCGTAQHAIQFAQRGCRVMGVDLDAAAVAVANQKLEKEIDPSSGDLTIQVGRVEDIDRSGFDLAVALFHVLTYITDQKELRSFLTATFDRLAPGGLFVADAWNGVAVFRSPPRNELRQWTSKRNAGTIRLTPVFDPMQDLVTVECKIDITSGTYAGSTVTHEYLQRLWTPRAVTDMLVDVGFQDLRVTPPREWDAEAKAEHWKVCYIARKPKA